MDKRYDQKSVKCSQCAWFIPAGKRDTPIDPDSIWPEGCKLYGYSLNDRWPLAENCKGFETPEQVQRRNQLEEMRKTRRK